MSHKSFSIQKIQYTELPGVGTSVVSQFLTSTVVRTGATSQPRYDIVSRSPTGMLQTCLVIAMNVQPFCL